MFKNDKEKEIGWHYLFPSLPLFSPLFLFFFFFCETLNAIAYETRPSVTDLLRSLMTNVTVHRFLRRKMTISHCSLTGPTMSDYRSGIIYGYGCDK